MFGNSYPGGPGGWFASKHPENVHNPLPFPSSSVLLANLVPSGWLLAHKLDKSPPKLPLPTSGWSQK